MEQQGSEACPPHRWFIEAQYGPEGGVETWTCTKCSEKKTVTRGHSDVAKPTWTVGKAASTPRPPPREPDAKPSESEASA